MLAPAGVDYTAQSSVDLVSNCFISDCLTTMEKIAKVPSDYEEKFTIPDGDKIRITLSDGEQLDRTCRYIDDSHLEVGNNLYHICEFAARMEQNGNAVIPLRSSLPEQCYMFVQTENLSLIHIFMSFQQIKAHLSNGTKSLPAASIIS